MNAEARLKLGMIGNGAIGVQIGARIELRPADTRAVTVPRRGNFPHAGSMVGIVNPALRQSAPRNPRD